MGDFTAWNQSCDWYMIVINKDNAIPEDYNPQITTYQSIQIDQRVLPHLQEMMDAASADGAGLWLASGYRDIALQTKLYNRKVNYFLGQGYSEESALAKAATIVAKPGTSEHNTGLSVDFNNQMCIRDRSFINCKIVQELFSFLLNFHVFAIIFFFKLSLLTARCFPGIAGFPL